MKEIGTPQERRRVISLSILVRCNADAKPGQRVQIRLFDGQLLETTCTRKRRCGAAQGPTSHAS
jgi:hypothetical protein